MNITVAVTADDSPVTVAGPADLCTGVVACDANKKALQTRAIHDLSSLSHRVRVIYNLSPPSQGGDFRGGFPFSLKTLPALARRLTLKREGKLQLPTVFNDIRRTTLSGMNNPCLRQ